MTNDKFMITFTELLTFNWTFLFQDQQVHII